MDWLSRYVAGEHETVWAEMVAVGADIVDRADLLLEAEAVTDETMHRVRRNLDVLESRLRAAGYRFAADEDEDWPHQPREQPTDDALDIIESIEAKIRGRFPVSVRSFIANVGWVDFNGELPGWSPQYVDGLQVHTDLNGLGDLLLDMIEHPYYEDDDGELAGKAHLELSADHLHKADISGGPPYGLAVPDASADGRWLYDSLHPAHGFVGYLRAVIADGGLPGWRRTPGDTPPALLDKLVADLLPF
ncbi:MAG: hypothetical protein JWO02_1596 [Solirubrobacterales bacterium]|nr:hypothetical protein [Solirubrobacterales bacterium]